MDDVAPAGALTRRHLRLPAIDTGRRAALAATGLVVALTLFSGWSFLVHGGPFFDDFWLRADMLWGRGPGRHDFVQSVQAIDAIIGYRPVSVPYFVALLYAAGPLPFVYTVWPTAVLAGLALALWWALRQARVAWHVALAAAALLAVIPFAAVARFWFAGAQLNASGALMALGFGFGARAVRGDQVARRSLVVSSAAIVAAVLLHELVGGLVLVLPLYYAAARGRLDRVVLRVFGLQMIVLIGFVLLGRTRGRTATTPFADWSSHAWVLLRDGLDLAGQGIAPEGGWRALLFALLLSIAAAAAWGYRRAPGPVRAALADARPELRRLALWAGGGLLAMLAGYVALIPAFSWYQPFQPGQGTRSNATAVIGLSVCYAALAGVVATAVACTVSPERKRTAAAALTALLVIPLVGDLAGKTRATENSYVEAHTLIGRVEAGLHATWPHGVAPGTTILSFGAPGNAAPNVPAFGVSWDLDGAVRLLFHTGRVEAWPIVGQQPVVCAADAVQLPLVGQEPQFGPQFTRPYGRVVFADPLQHRAERIHSAVQCRRALGRFSPGPFLAPPVSG